MFSVHEKKNETTPHVKGEDGEAEHGVFQNQDTLRNNLELVADKLGVSIEQLRAEKAAKEKEERQKRLKEREEKKLREKTTREAALDRVILDGYGQKYFVTLNGQRIKKVKGFEDLKCPECGVPIPQIRGWLHQMVTNRCPPVSVNINILLNSVFNYMPYVDTNEVSCKNGHRPHILVQELL
jgi:hypothetical protein